MDLHDNFPFRVHVVAAAIFDDQDNVLVALRPLSAHQGGLWEFPGGKTELGEGVEAALAREIEEELGIKITTARPLIRIPYDYPDKKVLLDVWRVERFSGKPHGREGQPIAWLNPKDIDKRKFPLANLPIITAVQLPSTYLITPEPTNNEVFFARLERALQDGVRLIQLRVKTKGQPLAPIMKRAGELCYQYDATLLVNAELRWAQEGLADGVHLTSRQLMALEERPLSMDKWVAASCHDKAELSHACRIGVDFAVVGPVQPTTSHPNTPVLGWEGFASLAAQATIPVYALGGMATTDLSQAWHHGGQGIAAITGLWR